MAAIDDYASFIPASPGLHVCRNGAVVTPSDATDLTDVSQYIYVGGTGAITYVPAGQPGTTVLLSAIPVGTLLPIAASRIKATGTTATLIVALW